MKKFIWIFVFILSLTSCQFGSDLYSGKPVGKKDVNFENLIREGEPESLAEIYFQHGNFINSQQFPPVVKPEDVLQNGKDWLLIDIRKPEAYEAGHINGAYNVPKEKVLDFLKHKHKASAYPKVVFICYSGQTASYVTGITRFAGFDNTYVMLFGMAGWNSRFAEPLKKGFGDRYPEMVVKGSNNSGVIEVDQHETNVLHALDLNKLPKLPKKLPTVLINDRAHQLLNQKRTEFLLKADEFFPVIKKDLNAYYSIFYIRKPQYYEAHIKGSHQFTPRKDLSLDGRLTEIPADKPLLIYCKTGHTGGNATAYLDMLGYKAHNLIFGAGSFMYSLWKEKGWLPDVRNFINDFPVVEGKKRTNASVSQVFNQKKNRPSVSKPVIKKRKKKEISGGCG